MHSGQYLKTLAKATGFIDCGVALSRKLDEEENHLKEWLTKGYHGKMKYMENHFEKRLDPALLLPGAKSVICFLYNYSPENTQDNDTFQVAKYAYGEDYHTVIKDKLHQMIPDLFKHYGEFSYRIFVDSAPVMERQWAALSGLGWIGKNSLLLRQGTGSYFFIATLITDLELEPDQPVTDHCGTCTACIDACPTNAIVADGVVDGSRCISYLTIELKDEIPGEFKGQTGDWIFGCDICQDVCPWNRFSKPHAEPRFSQGAWTRWTKKDWHAIDKETFESHFQKSAIQRAGFEKLKNSIAFNE